MSLGITTLWRARPLRLGLSIPREPSFFTFICPQPRPRPAAALSATLTRLSHTSFPDPDRTPTSETNTDGKDEGTSRDTGSADHHEEKLLGLAAPEPRKRKGTPEPKAMDRENEIQEIENAIERSHFARSILVKSTRAYRHPEEMRMSQRKHHKTVSEQVYLDRGRKNNGAPLTDWRKSLELMAQATPEGSLEWIEDGLRLGISRAAMHRILYDAPPDYTIASIRRRSGAVVKHSRRKAELLVFGTRQAINKAVEEFGVVAGRMTVTRIRSPDETGEAEESLFEMPPLSREENAYAKRQRTKYSAYETPMPSTWTPKSVEDYVVSLVDSLVEPSLHAPIYKPSGVPGKVLIDHERAIARRLVWLFHKVPKVASRSSLMIALAYLCDKGNKYLPEARELFVLMDRRGLATDPDVFNNLLRAAVKMRDMRMFQQTIRRMASRGLAPNLNTWLLFLRMFESIEVRSYVLQTMRVKNLLNTTEAIERVAQEMATAEAENAARMRLPLSRFMVHQEQRYGPSWLTRDAGNQVLHVLGAHGRFRDVFILLEYMGDKHALIPKSDIQGRLAVRPDAYTFNTIIARARVQGKIPLAVNVLRTMKRRNLARQPNRVTLHLLFEMAWRARLRTSIVVIWRYACLARITTFRMRSRVAALLESAEGLDRIAAAGEHTDSHRLTESTRRELGGEVLARELAGGREALAWLRACPRQLWGDDPPAQKIASIAARSVAVAFGEKYGPSIALGRALTQSVLMDIRCLRERKKGNIRKLLARSSVRSMILWLRRKNEEAWVDLAPLEEVDKANPIRPDATWREEKEDWTVLERPESGPKWEESEDWGAFDWPESGHRWKESDRWEVLQTLDLEPGPDGDEFAEVAGSSDARDHYSRGDEEAEEVIRTDHTESLSDQADDQAVVDGRAAAEEAGATNTTRDPDSAVPATGKQFAIINPHVWADDGMESEDESVSAPAPDADDHRTEVQRQNEEAILAALKQLEKEFGTR